MSSIDAYLIAAGLPQHLPGRHALVIPVDFHLIGAFGKCIRDTQTGTVLGVS